MPYVGVTTTCGVTTNLRRVLEQARLSLSVRMADNKNPPPCEFDSQAEILQLLALMVRMDNKANDAAVRMDSLMNHQLQLTTLISDQMYICSRLQKQLQLQQQLQQQQQQQQQQHSSYRAQPSMSMKAMKSRKAVKSKSKATQAVTKAMKT